MDVAALVKLMHENLSEIHSTITGLSTEEHNARLDELEKKRESLIGLLQANFDREKDELEVKHQAEISAIKEKRRIEDEEREARRRQEDEELQTRKSTEEAARQEKLGGEINNVEEDTEQEMDVVEEEARKLVDAGRGKLQELEEKRREINRLIDEQLQMPLPPVPSRKRLRGGKTNGASNGTPTSMPVPSEAESRSLGNSEKASEEAAPSAPPPLVESQPSVPEEEIEKDNAIVPEESDSRDVIIPSEAIENEPDMKHSEEKDDPTDKDEHESEQKPSEGHSAAVDEESQEPSQIVDSAIGLDPNVEAYLKDSQPASPSGNSFHDLPDNESVHDGEGDGSPHHDTLNLSDGNDAPQEPPSTPIVDSLKSKSLDDSDEYEHDGAHAEDPPRVEDQTEVDKVEATQIQPQADDTDIELDHNEAPTSIAAQDSIEREEENAEEEGKENVHELEAAHASDSIPLEEGRENAPREQTEEHEHEHDANETHSPVVPHQRDVGLHEEPTTHSDEHQPDKSHEMPDREEHDTDTPLGEKPHPLESEISADLPEVTNNDHPTSVTHNQEEHIQEVPSSPFLSRPITPVLDHEATLLSPEQTRGVEEQPPHNQVEEEGEALGSPRDSRPVTPVQNSETMSQQSSPEVEGNPKKSWWAKIMPGAKKDNSAVQTHATETSATDPSDTIPQQEPNTVQDMEHNIGSIPVPESTSEPEVEGSNSEAVQAPLQPGLDQDLKDGESGQMVSGAQLQSQAHVVDSQSGNTELQDVATSHTSPPEQTENPTFLDQDHEPSNDSESHTQEDSVIERTHDHDISPEVVDVAEGEVQEPPTDNNLESTPNEVHGAHSSADTTLVTDNELDPNGLEASGGLGEVTLEPQSVQQAQTAPEVQSTPSSPTISTSVLISDKNLRNEEGTSHKQEETLPEETLPEENVPEENLPEENSPAQTLPEKLSENLPAENLPEENLPEENVPEENVPEENVPEETLPEENVPENLQAENLPEETLLEENVPEENLPENLPAENLPEENLPQEDHLSKERLPSKEEHLSNETNLSEQREDLPEQKQISPQPVEGSPEEGEITVDENSIQGSPTMAASIPVQPKEATTKRDDEGVEAQSVPKSPKLGSSHEDFPEKEAEEVEGVSVSDSHNADASSDLPEENLIDREEEIAEAQSIPNSTIPIPEENLHKKDKTSEDESLSNISVVPEENASKQEQTVSEEDLIPNTTISISEQNSPEQDAENDETNSASSSPKPTVAISTSIPPENNSIGQVEEIAEPHSNSNSPNVPVSQENSSELEQEGKQQIVQEKSIPSSPKTTDSLEQSSSTQQEELAGSKPVSDTTNNTDSTHDSLKENDCGPISNDHSPEQVIETKNDLLHEDIDPTDLEHDPATSVGESGTVPPHSSHDVQPERPIEDDHVPATPFDSGENQELSDENADAEIQNVSQSFPDNESEDGHSKSNNMASHGGDDIGITKLSQHSQEDEQVGNSTGTTHLVVDESIEPNENLAEPSEQESTSESKEHPPSLAEQQSGHDINQNPGVELGKEADPNSATGDEIVGQADPVPAGIHPDKEHQSNGPLAALNAAVGNITSTIADAISGTSSTEETSEDRLGERKPDIELPEIEEPQSYHTPFEPGEFPSEEANPWESDVKSDSHLSADVPPRQAARSPLPVENDTVHGHEDLFDDDTASSYYGESEYYDHEDLHGDDTWTNDQIVQQMSNDHEEVSLQSDNGKIKEHMIDHTPDDDGDDALHTAIPPPEHPDYTGNQEDGDYHLNGHARTSPYYETEAFADQMDSPVEQQFTYGDPETEEGAKTPSLVPVTHNIPEVSPFALKRDTPNRGGLAASIHAPSNSTPTPPRQVEPDNQPEPDLDPEAFVPRDVTNVPWHARSDSVPRSLRSQSTLSSAPSSPVHSSLPIDKHEPVIRDSWPVSVGNGGRSRADTQFTDRNVGNDEFDPFKYDSGTAPSLYTASPSRATEIYPPEPQSNRNSLSGSPMFQKLRSMFEPGNVKGNDIGGSSEMSPTRPSRPVSTIFQPVARSRRSSLRKSISPTDQDDSPRRGGFLNEHEDEIDEHSALLHSTDEMDRN